MLRARDIMLAADDRITECIKWQAPTFVYKGNLATFNPRSKKHISLVFHTGAEIPGQHPHLDGDGPQTRTMKFAEMEEIEARKSALEAVVKAWCDHKDMAGKQVG